MKKLLFLSIFVLALYSLSASAAASVATVNNIDLGTSALGTSKVRTFTLTNDGNVNLTGVTFTFSDSDFTLSFNKTNFNLSAGASENINFTLTIPALTSTGNVTLGSVNLVSTELSKSPLFSIRADVVGGLIIEDLDVFLTTRLTHRSDGTISSGNEADTDVSDGGRLDFGEEDVGPGSELRFNFNIENTFEENDDIDIDQVTISVTIESIDDGDDIDEESQEFDVDSGKSQDVDVFIDIPLSVAEGAYDIVIEVEGEDTNNNVHTATMNLEMTVKKEPREVVVTHASLFPEKVVCGGTSTLTATIKNLGARIEENAGIEIVNSDLGVSYLQRNIELEEDPFDDTNEFTKSLAISTDRAKTKSGTYPIDVKAYIQDDIVWEKQSVSLVVEGCSDAAAAEEAPETEAVEETEEAEEIPAQAEETQQETMEEGVKVPVLKPETTTEVPLTKRSGFWFSIIALNVLVIAGIAYLIIKATGKKLQ
ncbi:hypothetical protein HYU09_00850 [Candidatus Woesearchaeota archaeon]|nr:hypothetical protein [Candidatus Woesearchaeota archaeon]